MDQVVELFARARRNQLAPNALRTALEALLSRHPQGVTHGLIWLDLAQTSEPVPVTDFVVLRQDIAEYLSLARARSGNASVMPGDGTERDMTVRQERPAASSDATLVAGQAPPGMADATVVAGAPSAGNSDPTMIAGVPPPGLSGLDATLVAAPGATSEATLVAAPGPTSEATLVATTPPPGSADPTLVAGVPPPGMDDATRVSTAGSADATQVAGSEPAFVRQDSGATLATSHGTPAEPTLAAPSLDRNAPSAHETPRSPWKMAATIVVLAALGAGSVWLVKGRTPPAVPASQPSPSSEAAAPARHEEMATPTPGEPQITTTPIADTPATAAPAQRDQNAVIDTPPKVVIKLEVERPQKPAPAPLPADMDGMMKVLDKRIAAGKLLPADDGDTATYVFEAMLKKNRADSLVSEARSKLVAAHRELAKGARQRKDLEAAQTHMDHAYDVMMMGTDTH